jgi:hypothetical protein
MRWTAWPAVLLVLLAAASVSVAQTGLELIDGRILEGVAVERAEDGFELMLETGARIVVPAALVRQVRLTVEPAEPLTLEELQPEGPVQGPEGEISAEELPLQPPRRQSYEQLAVFGPQRPVVARNTVDPAWWPDSDWEQELVENEFDPSRWEDPAIGSRWSPEESLDRAADWATSQSARWARPAIGSAWWPREGFSGIDTEPESD